MRSALSAVALGFALFMPRAAEACGGMIFHSEEHKGSIADQQVLIANGVGATVLVIEVGFKDADQEFAFLLPLQRAPHHVADGDKDLFKRIDDATAPRVHVIDASKGRDSGGGGCGCLGAAKMPGGAPGGSGGPPVEVVSRGATQTYEYVVVGGSDGATLGDWLSKNGFAAPSALKGSIDRYLQRGWLFLAARLKPDAQSGALAPIEIHYDPIRPEELEYPFELSGYSVRPGERVDVTLYLLANTPLYPENYPVRRIADKIRAISPTASDYESRFDSETRDGTFILEMGRTDGSPASLLQSGAEPVTEKNADAPSLRSRSLKMFPNNGAILRLRGRVPTGLLRDMKFKTMSPEAVVQDQFIQVQWQPISPGGGLMLLFGLGVLRRTTRPRVTSRPWKRAPNRGAS